MYVFSDGIIPVRNVHICTCMYTPGMRCDPYFGDTGIELIHKSEMPCTGGSDANTNIDENRLIFHVKELVRLFLSRVPIWCLKLCI